MSIIVLSRASKKSISVDIKMSDFGTRANIKIMVKVGWKETEIMEALGKVYRTIAPKKDVVYNWVQ